VRIASLLASGTELVCALGAGDELVARSHECDTPAWVTHLPPASRPAFDVSGTSAQIDARVRERLRAGQPLYEIDEALLTRLAPDVLITQTHCEVCAVTPSDLDRQAPSLCRQQVVALETGTLAAILDGFSAVARVIHREGESALLREELEARLSAVQRRVAGLSQPTVVCLEWIDPPYPMSNWAPALVEIAGGQPLLAAAGAHSQPTPWDAVRAADPDVLIVAPCGFSLDRTLEEMPALANFPGFADLQAVRTGRVYAADGNRHFNRSSPTLFSTPELIAEMLYPGLVTPVHAASYRRLP
jgi:iron complex transport system substrate-binding protein